MPGLIDPNTLSKEKISSVLQRNETKYGFSARSLQSNRDQNHASGFINSIERALFGEFNSG